MPPPVRPPPEVATAGQFAVDAAALRAVLDAVGDAVLVYELGPDGPGTFAEANAEAVRRYGYTREQLAALGPADLVEPGSVRLDEVYARLRRDGRAAVEAVHRAKDGRRMYVEVEARLFEADGRSLVVAAVRDLTERRRAEGALRESEEQLRVALSAAPLVLHRVGRDLRYEWVFNPRTGTEQSDVGMLAGAPLLPDEAERYRGLLTEVIETGAPARRTLTLSLPDGPTTYELTVSPVRDEDGRVVGATTAGYDVTELRRTEEALRRSDERLRLALSGAPINLNEVDRDLRYVWLYNPRTGAPAEWIGRRLDEIYPADAVAPMMEWKREVLATGAGVRRTHTFHLAEGPVTYDLSLEPVRDDAGEVVGVTTVAYDVTVRARTTEALRASEERLRLAQHAARIGTWEADPATGQATWSEGMWELVGVPPQEHPDRALWRSLIHPDDAAQAAERYDRALAGGDDFADEFRLVRPADGAVTWVASRGRVLRDEAGRAVRVLGVNFDVTERRTVEEALRASDERLRLAQRAARVGTWELDLATGGIAWSEGIWELLGVPAGVLEPTYATWLGLLHPDDVQALTERFERALEAGDEYADEYRLVRPADGAVLWVASRGRIVRDAAGRAVRVVGANVDVTERRAAEADLRESEAELRRFADAMPQLAYIAEGPPGAPPAPVFYNEQWYAYTGMAREGPLDADWGAYLHPDDLAAGFAEQQRSAATGTPFELEYRFRRSDGAYRWFLGRAVPARHGGGAVARWFGTCTDIDDLKSAEAALARTNAELEDRVAERTEALRESEARFRSLFRSTPIGVAVADPAGRLTEANPALHDLLGYAPGALRGMAVRDLTHPADRGLSSELYADVLAGRRAAFQIEKRYLREDGEVVWAQTTASSVRDADGTPLYVVASVADVTERRRLEQAAIEAAEAERRRLSYELHDDLAQRLAGASVLSHTLAEQLRDDAHSGAQAAVRLGDLVRDAMAHARALSRALAPVDLLSEGLAEALGRLSGSTEQAYGVRCRFAAAPEAAVADPAVATHLFRVAQEAVSNAARHAAASEIVVALESAGDVLRLTVRDDGRGLPPEAIGSTTGGLGLRTMRARAAALGGTLTVEGAPGQGTTVTCTVPRTARDG